MVHEIACTNCRHVNRVESMDIDSAPRCRVCMQTLRVPRSTRREAHDPNGAEPAPSVVSARQLTESERQAVREAERRAALRHAASVADQLGRNRDADQGVGVPIRFIVHFGLSVIAVLIGYLAYQSSEPTWSPVETPPPRRVTPPSTRDLLPDSARRAIDEFDRSGDAASGDLRHGWRSGSGGESAGPFDPTIRSPFDPPDLSAETSPDSGDADPLLRPILP